MRARWPGGTLDLSTWRENAFVVMFKGALRQWFDQTFAEGAMFLVRVDGSDDGPPDTLVFDEAPRVRTQEQRLPNAQVIAVRPDWTDHRGLLGAFNPLTRQYMSTPFLRLLLLAAEESRQAQAAKRPPVPFFAVLDEMNLARVEHYFADFLSALESGAPLHCTTAPRSKRAPATQPRGHSRSRDRWKCPRTSSFSARSTSTRARICSARRCSTARSRSS